MVEQVSKQLNIARQPVFNRDMDVYAYELLYRSEESTEKNRAFLENERKDDEFATLKVIANSQLMGLDKVLSGRMAFINFARQSLVKKIPTFFPSDSVGIEILETVGSDPELMKACNEMKELGYTIILDDFIPGSDANNLLEIADIVKIDLLASSESDIQKSVHFREQYDFKLLAEKVENQALYDKALAAGFDLFQGFHLSKPDIISIPDIPGYKINYLNILKKINRKRMDLNEIETVLKREISLTYRLLRLINQLSGGSHRIQSIRDALDAIGDERRIKNWLSLIVVSSVGHDKPQKLLNNTLIRAKFFELIALNTDLSDQKEIYFLFGMLSMLDQFLKKPMSEIIGDLPLDRQLKNALVGKKNAYYDLITLVNRFEQSEKKDIGRLSERVGIDREKLEELYLSAIASGNLHY